MVLGGVALVLTTPIESGQGTTLGGFAVLVGAALTFYSAHLNRKATSQEDLRAHHREIDRDLRSHFTKGAEQLANPSATVRLAGVYLLASLADDWYRQENKSERQVCIDVLCAYLRGDTMDENAVSSHFPIGTPYRQVEHATEDEGRVRQAIVAAVRTRTTRLPMQLDSPTWIGCGFDLSGAKLPEANLSVTDLTGALFAKAELSQANLKGCILKYSDLTEAFLEGAWLNGAILIGAGLPGAILDDANLAGASLRHAILTGAYLQRAICDAADFRGASLVKAHLNGAELVRADLRGAFLKEAALENANLSNSELDRADLRGANLNGATLTSARNMKLRFDDSTTWPNGTNQPPEWVHRLGEPALEIEFDSSEVLPALGLQEVGAEFRAFPELTNDVIAWNEDERMIVLAPGLRRGSVHLQVERYSEEPASEDGWDSVHEISIYLDSSDARLRGSGALSKVLPVLELGSGAGGYLIRLYESGRKDGVRPQPPGAVLSERYLMQVWPESRPRPHSRL